MGMLGGLRGKGARGGGGAGAGATVGRGGAAVGSGGPSTRESESVLSATLPDFHRIPRLAAGDGAILVHFLRVAQH